MSDLIERQAAIDKAIKIPMARIVTENIILWRKAVFVEDIEALPPVDAVPVRRGKWIAVTEDGDVYKRICSCCGQEAFFQNDDPDELYDGGRYELSDFCPHCGADMRGNEGEQN